MPDPRKLPGYDPAALLYGAGVLGEYPDRLNVLGEVLLDPLGAVQTGLEWGSPAGDVTDAVSSSQRAGEAWQAGEYPQAAADTLLSALALAGVIVPGSASAARNLFDETKNTTRLDQLLRDPQAPLQLRIPDAAMLEAGRRPEAIAQGYVPAYHAYDDSGPEYDTPLITSMHRSGDFGLHSGTFQSAMDRASRSIGTGINQLPTLNPATQARKIADVLDYAKRYKVLPLEILARRTVTVPDPGSWANATSVAGTLGRQTYGTGKTVDSYYDKHGLFELKENEVNFDPSVILGNLNSVTTPTAFTVNDLDVDFLRDLSKIAQYGMNASVRRQKQRYAHARSLGYDIDNDLDAWDNYTKTPEANAFSGTLRGSMYDDHVFQQQFQQLMDAYDYDAVTYPNAVEHRGSTSYMVTDPGKVRLRHAAFDPAKLGVPGLLKGLAPVVAAGGGYGLLAAMESDE